MPPRWRQSNTPSHSSQYLSSVSQCNPFTGRLRIPSPFVQPPVWQGRTISAVKMLLQHEENASDYPILPLFHMMNLNGVFLLDTRMQNVSLHCHIACFALFSLIHPASWSKDSLWVVFSATGGTTGSQVHNHSYEGPSQQITLFTCLWRANKAGNVFFLLEKAPRGRQAWQFGLCAALSPSVIKGGNSPKNCKENQGAGLEAQVIFVWNPSFPAKLKKKKKSWRIKRRHLPPSSSHKSSDHGAKHLHKSIKCSRETWHQPLGRTDTELPDHVILWDFI